MLKRSVLLIEKLIGFNRVRKSTMSVVKLLRSPAAERNKEHILGVLQQYVNQEQKQFALEIASGSGQHVVYFAQYFPKVTWQPSECEQMSMQSISGYIASNTEIKNVLPPVWIDTTQPVVKWGGGSLFPGSCDLILNVNMIHISEWSSTQGLFQGGSSLLKPGAILATYGPYSIHGHLTPESNVRFDQSLKQMNPEYGIRDIDDLEKLAQENDMQLEEMIDMPANNKMLIFRKKQ